MTRTQNTARLLTSAELGRRLDPPLGADRVRALAREGRIAVAAITESGQRLFDEGAVEALQRERRRGVAA